MNLSKIKLNKINPLFVLKVGIGSAVAIIVAETLGLMYSPSAGIITLLTVQNTKKETLLVASKRIISFLMAVVISYIMFSAFGYNPWVFGCFVLVFVGLSYLFNLKDGISMNAVLMTHFLIEQRVDWQMFVNEAMILGIGMGIGIILNLIMPNYKKMIRLKQHMLEDEMRKILKTMALALKDKKACLLQEGSYDRDNFNENAHSNLLDNEAENNTDSVVIDFRDIDTLIEELIQKAYEDAGNTLLSNTRYLISYLEMRKHQIEVLKVISRNIMDIPVLLKQSIPLAGFLERTSEGFHEMNNVKGLLEDLRKLTIHYKQDKLPVSREEFEYRAVLFQILNELKYFLMIKRNFVLELENKEMI
ncbi:MAG: hypothetical protein GX271_11675 [Clostridiales bacterium]|jgi:uncharacterized membrane protein YgaE (UPF0421/DUF939 family)|nr:hypothetical protein [Clostridiales bacterium]